MDLFLSHRAGETLTTTEGAAGVLDTTGKEILLQVHDDFIETAAAGAGGADRQEIHVQAEGEDGQQFVIVLDEEQQQQLKNQSMSNDSLA